MTVFILNSGRRLALLDFLTSISLMSITLRIPLKSCSLITQNILMCPKDGYYMYAKIAGVMSPATPYNVTLHDKYRIRPHIRQVKRREEAVVKTTNDSDDDVRVELHMKDQTIITNGGNHTTSSSLTNEIPTTT